MRIAARRFAARMPIPTASCSRSPTCTPATGKCRCCTACRLQLHEGEAHRHRRPQRHGQDDAAARRSWACCRRPAARSSVDGVDVTTWAAHERSRLGIAYVPQGRGILPGLSAHENLRLAWTAGLRRDRSSVRSSACVGIFPRLSRLLESARAAHCRAASSRSWRSRARSCRCRGCSFSTSPPRASSRPSSRRSARLLAALREKRPSLHAHRRAEPRTRARRRRVASWWSSAAASCASSTPVQCAAAPLPIWSVSAIRGWRRRRPRREPRVRTVRCRLASPSNGAVRPPANAGRAPVSAANGPRVAPSRKSAPAAPASATS